MDTLKNTQEGGNSLNLDLRHDDFFTKEFFQRFAKEAGMRSGTDLYQRASNVLQNYNGNWHPDPDKRVRKYQTARELLAHFPSKEELLGLRNCGEDTASLILTALKNAGLLEYDRKNSQ